MLDYCGGLLLAITMLGGLLSSKETVDEWETLQKNIKTLLRQGKINKQEDSNLGVSWVFWTNELCRLWMAEGFVSTKDAAYECLCELVQRCMVQVVEWGSTGRIKTCRIHDLMRDLCFSKAQEENFLQAIDVKAINSSSVGMTSKNLLSTNKVRKVAIYLNSNSGGELLSLIKIKNARLRSLICFSPELDTFSEQVMKPQLHRFHLLRVLKFENVKVGKFSKEIGDLIHLRFFSLKDSLVENSISSIGNLKCLQTLDLRASHYHIDKTQLPEIWKLELLRHLYLPLYYENSEFSPNLTKLTMVETQLKDDPMPTLERLPKLKILLLGYDSFVGTEMVCSRKGFPYLESLSICDLYS
ncbi:hypothetical protein TIFTF001_054590 [Ficus carica]|uniref:Uncharacterized protein n=1 Tax=Ficus carica TaxID=3494 RepID=A0AA88EDU3_FICCA|nr:hypothetical protein TIFTF001_054590 [Ficus carica]